MGSDVFIRPVTSGAWQQTDLLGALGMLEPLVLEAAIQVAEGRSVAEPEALDEPRVEIGSALNGDLPIGFGEQPLSPRGPCSLLVDPTARADAANGADQRADGSYPLEALLGQEAPSTAEATPVPLGCSIPAALPTESPTANAAIGGGSPAQTLSPMACPQLGADLPGVVLRSGRPESWRAPEAVPAPSASPELPLRSIGVVSAGQHLASAAACVAADALEPIDPLPTVPETLLILDTETTALRPEEGQCIEVGAVLFQVPHRAVLTQVSFLLPCDRNPAETVNGIPAAVTRLPQPWPAALACFQAMLEQADAVLAHNASFDRQWFGRGRLPPIGLPWICSMEDIRWPSSLGLRPAPSVQALALAHGVPVWAAHRALTDCTYLVQVLQRCVDLELLLAAALEPRSLMRAEVSYADRHLAREAGFRWDQPVPRAWTRRLSQREAISLPFPVHPVEDSRHLGQAC